MSISMPKIEELKSKLRSESKVLVLKGSRDVMETQCDTLAMHMVLLLSVGCPGGRCELKFKVEEAGNSFSFFP